MGEVKRELDVAPKPRRKRQPGTIAAAAAVLSEASTPVQDRILLARLELLEGEVARLRERVATLEALPRAADGMPGGAARARWAPGSLEVPIEDLCSRWQEGQSVFARTARIPATG